MQADAQAQRYIRHVSDSELSALAEQIQRHGSYFAGVQQAVWHRKPASHHVRVTNCLHLREEATSKKVRLQLEHNARPYLKGR